MDLLAQLLRSPLGLQPVPDFRQFWTATVGLRERFAHTVDRAAALGSQADRLAYAFIGGYSAAIAALDPQIGPHDLGALCATEEEGAHPRAIKTRLEGRTVTGAKRFVSGGALANVLLVVATEGTDAQGRNKLRVVRVAARSPGVKIEDMPDLPFVPEIPHGSVTFDATPIDSQLEGDGYEQYLKPFRTIEDLHVHAAVLGYLCSVSRRAAWPEALREAIVSEIVTARGLGLLDPRAPETHIALAGFLASGQRILAESEPHWASVPGDERERFQRDRPLFKVASHAREARRAKAWERIVSPKHSEAAP